MVSAHWENAPLTVGATADETPLTYDFWGFPQRYYDVIHAAPGAPALARRVRELVTGPGGTVHQNPTRGPDHDTLLDSAQGAGRRPRPPANQAGTP